MNQFEAKIVELKKELSAKKSARSARYNNERESTRAAYVARKNAEAAQFEADMQALNNVYADRIAQAQAEYEAWRKENANNNRQAFYGELYNCQRAAKAAGTDHLTFSLSTPEDGEMTATIVFAPKIDITETIILDKND